MWSHSLDHKHRVATDQTEGISPHICVCVFICVTPSVTQDSADMYCIFSFNISFQNTLSAVSGLQHIIYAGSGEICRADYPQSLTIHSLQEVMDLGAKPENC